jgi:uncharacterized ferritin-like protein (DUF455 family)
VSWRHAVLEALCEADLERKCALVARLRGPDNQELDDHDRGNDGRAVGPAGASPAIPGQPVRPVLVSPREVPRRNMGSAEGRAALVHAVAHIEFNAINLALDAAWRFGPTMPTEFRSDWISVAQDEARHFRMLSDRLRSLGYAYGDFPAHNGLWESAEKTAHDVLARMALVPRVLEARGLDVTPGIITRLEQAQDAGTVGILRVILDEEVRHVAIGTRWFRYLCEKHGLEPQATFRRLLAEYNMSVRPPFNTPARRAAGFSEEEMAGLV